MSTEFDIRHSVMVTDNQSWSYQRETQIQKIVEKKFACNAEISAQFWDSEGTKYEFVLDDISSITVKEMSK